MANPCLHRTFLKDKKQVQSAARSLTNVTGKRIFVGCRICFPMNQRTSRCFRSYFRYFSLRSKTYPIEFPLRKLFTNVVFLKRPRSTSNQIIFIFKNSTWFHWIKNSSFVHVSQHSHFYERIRCETLLSGGCNSDRSRCCFSGVFTAI